MRLIGHADALSTSNDEWITDSVRESCVVDTPNAPFVCLGTSVGDANARVQQFERQVDKVNEVYGLIGGLLDPAVELALGRVCAGVGKVAHLLRTAGTDLPDKACAYFDNAQGEFIDRTLAGDLGDSAHQQAGLGVQAGGLGMRRAVDLRCIAATASRVEARPFVAKLFRDMDQRGFGLPGCLARFDAALNADVAALVDALPNDVTAAVRDAIEMAGVHAQERFEALANGRRPRDGSGPPVGSQHAGDHLLPAFGVEDPEHPTSVSPRLQHKLSKILDETVAERLCDEAASAGRRCDAIRLRDLADPSVNHEYLWLMGDAPTGGLSGDDFIIDVRLRLGASQCDDSRLCGSCQRSRLDVQANHAQCCAPGPSNSGHNDVRDSLFDLVRIADSTAETEALGLLCTAPSLRPADILTSAVPGSALHALDVTVVAPLAHGAGDDPCAAAVRRKLSRYRAFFPELSAGGVRYVPLAWTYWGREGDAAAAMIVILARRAARRRGFASSAGLLRRARCSIGLALANRRAAMVRACLANCSR